MATKRYAMGLALALGCSSTGESSGSDATGATTTTTTSTVTSSGEATSTGMTTADVPTTSSGSTSSSTTVASESTSESTGEPPVCEGGTAALLFGTAENIGTITYPGGGPYLWGMQSWFNDDTGDYKESADDFEVPAGVCWCIASVAAFGQFNAMPAQPQFSLRLYDDVDGLPATDPWFVQDIAPGAIESAMIEDPVLAAMMRYQLELQEPVLVQPGHAWLSTSGLVSGQITFSMALSTEAFGAATTAYRSTECSAWGDLQACHPTLPLPELAFELHGYEVPCM